MICKNCGAQIADGSAFCTHCGNAVTVQPEYQQPYATNTNHVATIYLTVKQYIEIAGSVLTPSIVGLALSYCIPLIGQIIGLIMAGSVSSKINSLPLIDETALDPTMLGNYNSARKKVKTASILSKISKIYSIVMLIFWIGFIAFYVLYFLVVVLIIGNM